MKKISFYLIMILLPLLSFGQEALIRGTVTNGLTNQAVGGTSIRVSVAGTGTVSDSLGNYGLALKPGNYTLTFSKVGYKTISLADIQIGTVKPTIVDVAMEQITASLNEVKIVGSRRLNKTMESPLSLRSIGVSEIKRNPGGNRDISKVIQSLPGVSSPVSFRNDIIIRGGAPNENRFYLDEIEIPNINHFATQGASGGPVGLINVVLLKK